jgi:hypothetical protein
VSAVRGQLQHVPVGLLVLWGLLKENYAELKRASRPGESRVFNRPLGTRPIGYYVHRLKEEERKEFERLKVENAALKRQLGLPH